MGCLALRALCSPGGLMCRIPGPLAGWGGCSERGLRLPQEQSLQRVQGCLCRSPKPSRAWGFVAALWSDPRCLASPC